jgi:hypothetical protein
VKERAALLLVNRKNDGPMFKIELTRGLGWDSTVLATIQTMERDLCDAEEFARQWLRGYQVENPERGANGYRISDTRRQRLKSST